MTDTNKGKTEWYVNKKGKNNETSKDTRKEGRKEEERCQLKKTKYNRK